MSIETSIENQDGFNAQVCYYEVIEGDRVKAFMMLTTKAKATPYRLAARCAALMMYACDRDHEADLSKVVKLVNDATNHLRSERAKYTID